MSADNWAVCPKCKGIQHAKKIAAIRRAEQVAKNAYGKVPPEKYRELLHAVTEAEVTSADTGEETFREDFYIGTDEKGLFVVTYRGECQNEDCKFTVKFKHSEQKTI